MTEPNPPQVTDRLSRPTLALAFAGALAFLYLRTVLLPATPFVGTGDQTLFFSRAVRILHGQVLYRDFFELVTPGTDLLYAAGFHLFGIHAWMIPAWTIAFGLTLACVITYIASRMLHGRLILLPALLFLVFDFNSALDLTHHWFSTLAAVAAVAFLMDGTSVPRIYTASSLCAIATLFTQTQGSLAFVALIVYLLWLKRSGTQNANTLTQLAALVLPFALILSSVLGYYIHKAGFNTVFSDLVLFPLRFLSTGKANTPRAYLQQFPPVQSAADILRLIPFIFIYALVPYIYLFGFYQLWRRRNDLPPTLKQRLVLLHLVGIALFLAVANGPRFFRLSTVAPPAILILTWLLSRPSRGHSFARTLLCILAALFALLLPLRRQTQWHATLNLPIGRAAFGDILLYREYQWLAQRTHPSEPFFNSPGLCLYLSLTNPTPSEFVSYDDFTRPEQVSAIIQSLQHHPPHFVVLFSENIKRSDSHDNAEPFRQYVHDNYHLAQTFPIHGSIQYDEQIWELAPASESSR